MSAILAQKDQEELWIQGQLRVHKVTLHQKGREGRREGDKVCSKIDNWAQNQEDVPMREGKMI